MEKYGEIPKRFSKAWWSYFWYYYKWHTIAFAFVLILLVTTLVQCANRIHYDLQVTYAGETVYTDQSIDALEAAMAREIDDITGNGKQELLLQTLTIAKEGTQNAGTEYNQAMFTKLDLEFETDDTYLFLFSGEQMNRMIDRPYAEEIFSAVDEWAQQPIDAAMTAKKKGTAYAVKLSDSKLLHELGFVSDDLYVMVRSVPDKEKQQIVQKHDNAVKLANMLLVK